VHFGKKAEPSEYNALEEDVDLLKELNAAEVSEGGRPENV
jgi:hypothetical protein